MEQTAVYRKASARRSFQKCSSEAANLSADYRKNRSCTFLSFLPFSRKTVKCIVLVLAHYIGSLAAPIVVAMLTRKLLELFPGLFGDLPDESMHLIPAVVSIAVDRLIVKLAAPSGSSSSSSNSGPAKSLTLSPSYFISSDVVNSVDTVNDSTIDRWSRTPAAGQDRVTNEIPSSAVSDEISPVIDFNSEPAAAASRAAAQGFDITRLNELLRTAARDEGSGSGEVFATLISALQSANNQIGQQQQQQQQQQLHQRTRTNAGTQTGSEEDPPQPGTAPPVPEATGQSAGGSGGRMTYHLDYPVRGESVHVEQTLRLSRSNVSVSSLPR